MKRILVCGAGGFIGTHLCNTLAQQGHFVVGADLKYSEFCVNKATRFKICDLALRESWLEFSSPFDEIYQLAADMGGAQYIFTGENDSAIMTNSSLINLNCLEWLLQYPKTKIFYSSSACIYPKSNQLDPRNPICSEESAYPANPDSEYGWEKLFSERLYLAYHRNHGIPVRIARFHNIFGPYGTYKGGREKAPAALCRKVAMAVNGGVIDILGDGTQTRSFLFIDECIAGIQKLMESDFTGPVNIGSEEMVTIADLAKRIIKISGKDLTIRSVPGPIGVNGRNSDNKLIYQKLNWKPTMMLDDGLKLTYSWVENETKNQTLK